MRIELQVFRFASERGIRGSEVGLLVGLRIFSLSRARDKTQNIFLYILKQLGFNLLTLVCHFRYRRVLGVDL